MFLIYCDYLVSTCISLIAIKKYNYNLLIKNEEEDVSNQIQGVSRALSEILEPKEKKIPEQIQ